MAASQKRRMNATKKADQMFSAHIRARGICEMAALFPKIECNGNLQCAHIVSRRYRAVRWFDENAYCACAAHHLYQTHHPLEFENALDIADPGLRDELKYRATHEPPMDMAAVIERLKESA